MNTEWKTFSIKELTEKVAMGPFGSSIKVETFVPNGTGADLPHESEIRKKQSRSTGSCAPGRRT